MENNRKQHLIKTLSVKDYIFNEEKYQYVLRLLEGLDEPIPTPYQNDRLVVLLSIFNNGLNLQYASPALRNDKSIIIMACMQDFQAIQYSIHKKLKTIQDVFDTHEDFIAKCFHNKDREIQNQALNHPNFLLLPRYQSDILSDEEWNQKYNQTSYQYKEKKMKFEGYYKKETGLVHVLFERDYIINNHDSSRYHAIALNAALLGHETKGFADYIQESLPFQIAILYKEEKHTRIEKAKSLIDSAIEKNKDLKKDREIYLFALFGGLEEKLPNFYKDDRTIAAFSVLNDGLNLQYASDELRSDISLILFACTNDYQAIQYSLNEKIKTIEDVKALHPNFILKCFKNKDKEVKKEVLLHKDFSPNSKENEIIGNDPELNALYMDINSTDYVNFNKNYTILNKKILTEEEAVIQAIFDKNFIIDYPEWNSNEKVCFNSILFGDAFPFYYPDKVLSEDLMRIYVAMGNQYYDFNPKSLETSLLAIHYNSINYGNVDYAYRNDFDIAKFAITTDPYNYPYISSQLKKNKELALIGLLDENIYEEFDEEIAQDIDIQYEALRNAGYLLEGALSHLIEDKKAVSYALSSTHGFNNAALYDKMPKSFFEDLEDRSFIEMALRNHGNLLKYFPESIRKNKDYVIPAIQSGATYADIDESLLLDRDVCYNLAARDSTNIFRMKTFDKEFYIELFTSERYYTTKDLSKNIPYKFSSDPDFIKLAFEKTNIVESLLMLSNIKDKSILDNTVKDLIEKNGCAFLYGSKKLLNNKDCLLKAIANTKNPFSFYQQFVFRIKDFNKKILNDLDVVQALIKMRSLFYKHFSFTVRSNKEITLLTLHQYNFEFDDEFTDYIPRSLLNDQDIINCMIRNSSDFSKLPKKIRNDENTVIRALEYDPSSIAFASYRLKSKVGIAKLATWREPNVISSLNKKIVMNQSIFKFCCLHSPKIIQSLEKRYNIKDLVTKELKIQLILASKDNFFNLPAEDSEGNLNLFKEYIINDELIDKPFGYNDYAFHYFDNIRMIVVNHPDYIPTAENFTKGINTPELKEYYKRREEEWVSIKEMENLKISFAY